MSKAKIALLPDRGVVCVDGEDAEGDRDPGGRAEDERDDDVDREDERGDLGEDELAAAGRGLHEMAPSIG